jgi:hypothetical protein
MGVLGTDLGAADHALYDRRLAATRATLGEAAFAEGLTGAEASPAAGG